MNEETLELGYRETRSQLADQSAEIERIDRKAATLLTPVGLLIGFGLNSHLSRPQLHPVDSLFFLGLIAEVLALLCGVLAMWPRRFRRADPGGRSGMAIARQDLVPQAPQLAPHRRMALWLANRLLKVAHVPEDRRSHERQYFYLPTWLQDTHFGTVSLVTTQLAAAFRINRTLLSSKVQWLTREYGLMFVGAFSLSAWFMVRALQGS